MTRSLRSARGAASTGLTVAVTGAAGQVGQALCRRLVGTDGVRQVLAIDTRKPGVPGVRWRRADPADPANAPTLHRVDALVHLPPAPDPEHSRAEHRRRLMLAVSVALTAAAANGVPHVVLLSSARVYGAHADNPVPLPDDAPLRAAKDGGALGDLLEVEEYAVRAARAYRSLGITVLRPALLVGPGLEDAAEGLLDGPRLLVVRGGRPCWQFCHVDDLAAAVEAVLLARLTGPVTVASDGWIEQDELERILGRRRVELPAEAAFGAAGRLHELGMSADPASTLTYLMHPWVVGSARLRELGWQAAHTNAEALESYAEGRPILPSRLRITARSATAAGAAAGATVALVGTAALVRRARKRRRTGT